MTLKIWFWLQPYPDEFQQTPSLLHYILVHYQQFQSFLKQWYLLYGRHDLPWRHDLSPYAILVSELMLQQTQVDRVRPKFLQFMQQFPDVETLSRAKVSDVLIAWQGLGYNRRAKYLWQTARVVTDNGGVFPKTEAGLQRLPGVGPYTAGAIAAFSYNIPVILIETNVRTVFLYHFFPQQTDVSDTEILPLIKASLDEKNPREWYWALMDYGSHLKKTFPNPNRRSRQYTKQSTFVGSKRQVRGEFLRLLAATHSLSHAQLQAKMTSNPDHFSAALESLLKEGLVIKKNGNYQLAELT